jgi:peptide methionine sulfoxide reductase MsrB
MDAKGQRVARAVRETSSSSIQMAGHVFNHMPEAPGGAKRHCLRS